MVRGPENVHGKGDGPYRRDTDTHTDRGGVERLESIFGGGDPSEGTDGRG